jgi:hypothetical protein
VTTPTPAPEVKETVAETVAPEPAKVETPAPQSTTVETPAAATTTEEGGSKRAEDILAMIRNRQSNN